MVSKVKFKPDPKILDRLEVELTDDLFERLVAYSDMKAKRRPWYGLFLASGATMAEGHKPTDIVQTAIIKTIEAAAKGPGKHRRVWDGRRDLYDHLTSAIDSELSNLGNSWVNSRFRRASEMLRVSEDGLREDFFASTTDYSAETPEEVALESEVEERSDAFVCGLVDFLGEDEFLISVVQEILDGARKPAEIADTLGVKADEVYKARKRLRRKVAEYNKMFTNDEEVNHG